MLLTRAVDRARLHAVLGPQLRRMLARAARPNGGRIAFVGPDPLRLLFVGDGLGVGYGASSIERTLAGTTAQRLASLTARGVVAECRTEPGVPIREAVDLLGAVGASTYDVVVWCPTFTELPKTFRFGSWQRALEEVLEHLDETGEAHTRIVLLGLPPISGSPRLERIARGWMSRIDDRMRALATRFPRVSFVPSLPLFIESPHALPLNDQYYAACGDRLAAHLADRFRSPATPLAGAGAGAGAA